MSKKQEKIIIKRPTKEQKDHVISLRVTDQEKESTTQMAKELRFKSVRNLFLYCKYVLEELYVWHKQGYSFFIKKKDEEEYREVGFEFQPDDNKS